MRARPHLEQARGKGIPRHRHRRERAVSRAGPCRSSGAGLDVDYVQGDMRKLPWRDRFDGLVNWFTSFGYFSDEQNKAVLRQFHDALSPGGRLILETQNITRILLQPRPQHWVERDGDLMLDEWKLDVENARFVTERNDRARRDNAADAVRRALVQPAGASRLARGSRLRERSDAGARA